MNIRYSKTHWKLATGDWKLKTNSGQALIMLLFFIMIGMIIASAAITIIGTNTMAATDIEQGEVVREMAETGAERAILKILRTGSAYTGETLTNADVSQWAGGWNDVITVSFNSGTNTYTIDSKATAGNYVKKIEVIAGYDANSQLSVNSWKEIN